MSAVRARWSGVMLCAVFSVLMGCGDAPTYVVGQDLDALSFNLHTANMGIYPDTSVLQDPANPFAMSAIADETKWIVTGEAGPVAAFYIWATILARIPTGEAQYYAATALSDIYTAGLADAPLLPYVRLMAIQGFQSLLDHFPTSVSYQADGTSSYPLAPAAYQGIVNLGGSVQGNWVVIELEGGGTAVIQLEDDASEASAEEGR